VIPAPPLLVVTDRTQARLPLEAVAEAVFAAGGRWLSLREKDLDPGARLALLRRLAAIGRRWGAVVGVHGDLAAAAAVPDCALHLGAGGDVAAARTALGSGRLLGLSAHGGDDLRTAAADYVTLSPVRLSRSKPGYGPALGLDGLARAAGDARCPVIALGGIGAGGIGAADVAARRAAGAAGVAVMGDVMRADDPGAVVRTLLRGLR
jgi:thiamine-phosphate pyrophosphorylase